MFWLLGSFSAALYEQGMRVLKIVLRNASVEPVQLSSYLNDPMVINLRATREPLCRRRMSVLQSVSTPLETQDLSLGNVLFDNVLFDRSAKLAQE